AVCSPLKKPFDALQGLTGPTARESWNRAQSTCAQPGARAESGNQLFYETLVHAFWGTGWGRSAEGLDECDIYLSIIRHCLLYETGCDLGSTPAWQGAP